MPPREQTLPEGTDKVVAGASKTDTAASSGGGNSGGGASAARTGSGGGFVASGGGNDTGGGTDKIVSQVRDQVNSLREQATGKAREYAEGGKDRTTQLLDDIAEIIHDAARSIDDRLGDQYGEYAHKAGDAVQGLAGSLRGKSLEDLLDGTRTVVRKSPAVTVGTAALLGFVLVRLVKSGLDSDGGVTGSNRSGGNRSSGKTGSGA
ncbi:MAG TPA: hypothetical protein VF702_11715 [Allosphingosinicella sp.]|jgi:ElaB/YqjD/DUF883 family membrane-anchored ribosome-binding protein